MSETDSHRSKGDIGQKVAKSVHDRKRDDCLDCLLGHVRLAHDSCGP